MKRSTLFIVFLSFVSAILIFIINFIQHSQMTTLKEENRILYAENKQLKAASTYDQELLKVDLEDDYTYWSNIEKIAEQMVSDSEGRFKQTWAIYLTNEAEKYAIDPFLVYELLKVETGYTFDPHLIGPKTKYGHAYGMSQFMKNTAPWVAELAGLPYSDDLLFDPYYSMQLAIVYLDFLHHKYQNWDEALTAYHRGMTGMEQYRQKTGSAKSHYAERILTNAEGHHTFAIAK
ncbi:lytic transglycosylase domain-containing protein [Amphibacillus sp. MSJ-3]|uniref:lytic transglycosylase domain-containing protein n=1 Tax=Amphibacillus sp. MSJ-3 TaxID=2841505 RepID=UPI00209D015C|nr:lytic transglycosylase domain-containing protein [Amphibacillus sp. MSJ-3]